MKRLTLLWLGIGVLLAIPPHADANVRVGWLSQQVDRTRASIGASIRVSSGMPGRSGAHTGSGSPTRSRAVPPPPIQTLSSGSPQLRNSRPAGPGSFWYTTLTGLRCIYFPNSPTPCFNVVTPRGGAAAPVNPALVAAAAARRLSLGPGRIEASPSPRADGLTGAASWFWLSSAQSRRSVSVSLGGERVTVTASRQAVSWAFGDGSSVRGGPGVPYHPGVAPLAAIRHRYQTRCLPGDQGRDPYVLASCTAAGYAVSATLVWAIGYRASGPVAASGILPSRTAQASLVYPVSEARGFLVAGGSR